MAKGADPVQAARAVATYFPADPAVWIERAAMAGMLVTADDNGGLLFDWTTETDHGEVVFLNCWLNLTPGGHDAVRKLLCAERR